MYYTQTLSHTHRDIYIYIRNLVYRKRKSSPKSPISVFDLRLRLSIPLLPTKTQASKEEKRTLSLSLSPTYRHSLSGVVSMPAQKRSLSENLDDEEHHQHHAKQSRPEGEDEEDGEEEEKQQDEGKEVEENEDEEEEVDEEGEKEEEEEDDDDDDDEVEDKRPQQKQRQGEEEAEEDAVGFVS
jgi:hypothetical protein